MPILKITTFYRLRKGCVSLAVLHDFFMEMNEWEILRNDTFGGSE